MFFPNSILEINFGWWLRNPHTMGGMSNRLWWLEIRMMGRSFGNFSKHLNEIFVPKMSRLFIIRKFRISTDFLCALYPHIFLQITWMGWNTTSRSPNTIRYMGVKRYPSNFTITILHPSPRWPSGIGCWSQPLPAEERLCPSRLDLLPNPGLHIDLRQRPVNSPCQQPSELWREQRRSTRSRTIPACWYC